MHFNSLFSGLLASLILVASVSAATQQLTSVEGPTTRAEQGNRCSIDRLVHSELYTEGRPVAALNPADISLLNWNIYKGKRDNWAIDFKRYSYKHDVVTVQEAHLGDDLESLLDTEHRHWTLNAAFNYQDQSTGVLTASNVRPVYACGQRALEPLIRTPKTSLVSYYPVAGMSEYLLVANIHGINFTLGVDAYNKQIEQLYDILRHHQGPVVLAGDFNTWSEKRMRIVERLARRLSLTSLDYTNHNRTSVFGMALDHVFYRGLEPLEHDTWHVTSSDHNPTRVRFRVKNYYLSTDGVATNEIDENNC